MTHPLVITRPLGGSKLGRAAAAGDVPAEWFPARPRGADQWRARIESVRLDTTTARWFETLAPALGASGAAAARLERAARGHGVVVTTGQQPGLFGGPVYTWSKALSALALADELERASGKPVAPVFWAATDDADFEEARSTLVAVPGGVRRLSLPDSRRPGLPMADVPLDDITALLEELSSGAGSAADARVLEYVRDAYRDDHATVGSAYVRLLRSVLEPLGVAVLDASHPAARGAMHPVMTRALERHEALGASLARRSDEIRARGFDLQVELVKDLTLVSRTTAEGKERVHRRNAAAAARSDAPGTLGPTVLLRPVAERAILPTVAYLAGPGELAYFAQVSAVAESLAVAAPLALPRWSCTIVEPHIDRILERYRIAADDLAHENAVEMRLAREAMPADVARALADLRDSLGRTIGQLAEASAAGDSPLVDRRVPEGARINIAHRIDRLERRLVSAVAHRARETAHDIATARAALYPSGKPQERALNFMPMLARQGRQLLDAMLAQASRHAARLVAPDDGAARGEGDARGSTHGDPVG